MPFFYNGQKERLRSGLPAMTRKVIFSKNPHEPPEEKNMFISAIEAEIEGGL